MASFEKRRGRPSASRSDPRVLRGPYEDGLEVIEVIRAGSGPAMMSRSPMAARRSARFPDQPCRPHDRAIAGGTAAIPVLVNMRAARAVTPLARRAEIGPRGRIRASRGPVVVLLLADVAPEAVLVPLLHRRLVVFVRTDDFHVVEPRPPLHVPAGCEHDDPAILNRR